MFENNTKLQKRSNKGFTLIELLVVVVIVGILAAVALPNFLGQSGKARTTEATATIDAMKSGQEAYLNDNQQYWGNALSSAGAGNTLTTIAANADTLGGALVTPGAVSTISATLGVNFDANRFADANSNGAAWTVGINTVAGTAATNYVIGIDGGATNTTTQPLKGLAASFTKTTYRTFIDGNSTV